MTHSIPVNRDAQLQDRVILIINGLSERGGVLARMLARHGANVAIIGSQPNAKLSRRIQQDVAENGRRCLVITPNAPIEVEKKNLLFHQAMNKIIDTFGRLDAFISYPHPQSEQLPIDPASKPTLFDPEGMTMAALKYIMTSNQQSQY